MTVIIAIWMFAILFVGVVAIVAVIEIEPLWRVRRAATTPGGSRRVDHPARHGVRPVTDR